MKPTYTPPRHVNWATGALSGEPLMRKTTHLGGLAGVFVDDETWRQGDSLLPVYTVEIFDSPSGEGELYTGVTHLNPGFVGEEYFMTHGHFHARREQGEVYFGLRGAGLLLLQDEHERLRLEQVKPG